MAPPTGKRIKQRANIAQATIPQATPAPPIKKFRYKTVAKKNPMPPSQPRPGPKTRGGFTGSALPKRSSARLSSMARKVTDTSSSKKLIDISQTSSSDSSSSDTSSSSSSQRPTPRKSPSPDPRSSPPQVQRQQTPTPSPVPSPPLSPVHSPSPAPSPIPPHPADIVTARLQALSEGKLTIHYERGFLLNEPRAIYREMYVDRAARQWFGWTNFVEQPTVDVPVQLIHEFVANFPDERHPTLVPVRGRFVDISPAAINGVFGFQYGLDEPDAYTLNLNDSHIAAIHADVGRVLCSDPKAKWDSDLVSTTAMTKKAQIWAKFVRSRLVPSQHCKKLTKQVAMATYCILSGARFHPSRLMYQTILANSKTTDGPFYLPCLVKLLCDAAGVPTSEADTVMVPRPRSAFDEVCLKRICSSLGKRRRAPIPAQSTQKPSTSAPLSTPPARGKLTALEEKVENQNKIIQAMLQFLQLSNPFWQAAFKEMFPDGDLPEFPSILQEEAGPSSSKAPMMEEEEPQHDTSSST